MAGIYLGREELALNLKVVVEREVLNVFEPIYVAVVSSVIHSTCCRPLLHLFLSMAIKNAPRVHLGEKSELKNYLLQGNRPAWKRSASSSRVSWTAATAKTL